MPVIIFYQQACGATPYKTFLSNIRDNRTRKRLGIKVQSTLSSDARHHCKRLPCGNRHIYEIKLVGKSGELGGYRVYFGVFGNDIIVVLNAGGKSKKGQQNKDIKQAEKFYDDFSNRRNSYD